MHFMVCILQLLMVLLTDLTTLLFQSLYDQTKKAKQCHEIKFDSFLKLSSSGSESNVLEISNKTILNHAKTKMYNNGFETDSLQATVPKTPSRRSSFTEKSTC